MATGIAIDVVMPQMGVSVSEGTITKWLKSEGDPISADESLVEISTDKVDTEVPSPASGVLQQILVQEGETVAVGTKIALIAPEGAPVEREEPPGACGGRGTASGARANRRARAGTCARAYSGGGRRGGQRTAGGQVRLSRGGPDRGRAQRGRLERRRHRPRGPRDEEGHPRVHRVRPGGSGAGPDGTTRGAARRSAAAGRGTRSSPAQLHRLPPRRLRPRRARHSSR